MSRNLTGTALLTLLVAAAGPAAPVAQAAQSFDACTGFVTVLPTTISQPGIWCLDQNLATSALTGNAIEIAADNVTLDCNDFKVDGAGAGLATQARGVYASNRLNVTVRRCGVRGFYRGISLSAGGGHVIEGNRLDGNTFQAINVNGDGSAIRDNRIFDTGGSTVTATAFGIVAFLSTDVRANRVYGVAARTGGGGTAYGMFISGNPDGTVEGNQVGGVLKDGAGTSNGIWLDASTRVAIVDNVVTGDASFGGRGIRCSSVLSRARDNVVSGFNYGLTTCGDAGGNDVTP